MSQDRLGDLGLSVGARGAARAAAGVRGAARRRGARRPRHRHRDRSRCRREAVRHRLAGGSRRAPPRRTRAARHARALRRTCWPTSAPATSAIRPRRWRRCKPAADAILLDTSELEPATGDRRGDPAGRGAAGRKAATITEVDVGQYSLLCCHNGRRGQEVDRQWSGARSKAVRIASSHLITTLRDDRGDAAVRRRSAARSFRRRSARRLAAGFGDTLEVAFLLNIAIILFGWRRSKDLKEALDAYEAAERLAQRNANTDPDDRASPTAAS